MALSDGVITYHLLPERVLEVDRSQDPKRAPGPINLQRYVGVPAYAGIATFMGIPICLNQADLKAGKVDVAIMGAPVDMGSGARGAAFGPRYLRADERGIENIPAMLTNADTRIRPFDELKVVDYGDAAVDPFSIEHSMEPIRKLVCEIAEVGAIPIVLGGDHSILWPDAAAVAEVYGPGNVGVIHLDAHPDCSPHLYGHHVSHGTPIRRLIEDEHIPARNFIQIGLRTVTGPDEELWDWMRENGMRSHFMAEIDRCGFQAVLEKAIAEALDGPKYLYLSLDIDVLDPAFAPGTGTPEVAGLTNRELLPAIRRIGHDTPVVGMEVVEVAPLLDHSGITTMNARKAIFEAMTGFAMRKKGILEPNYMDPVASGKVPFSIKESETLQAGEWAIKDGPIV
jgi:agmatinase